MQAEAKVYQPHPSAIPFHESAAQVKALCGPVGSGKSLGAGMEFVFLCLESSVPVRGVVFRESYRQLHDSTRQTLQNWFGASADYVKTNETMKVTLTGADGIVRTHTLAFRHARRAEDASNLLSTEYGFIWLEEPVPAYESNGGIIGGGLPEGLFKLAMTRLRQPDLHRRQIVLTFNPPSTFHWIYRTFFKPSASDLMRGGMALFRQPPGENRKNLPDGYYEKLLEVLDQALADRFVRGEPVTLYAGQRVYPEAYEQIHFADDLHPMPAMPLVIGFDYGLTPCALVCQVMPSGALRCFRELQLFDAGAKQLAEQLTHLLTIEFPSWKKWRCWGDPMGCQRSQADTDASTAAEILADRGFPVQPGATNLLPRIESVKDRLKKMIDGKPALLIDKRCATLMEGLLGGYRYPKTRDGRLMHEPAKDSFSHLANALEYVCTGEFALLSGAPTQDLKLATLMQRPPVWDPLSTGKPRRRGSWMVR